MSGFLTEDEVAALTPSELLPHATPIPTQIVSSDEFTPAPQSEKQREAEARLWSKDADFGPMAAQGWIELYTPLG